MSRILIILHTNPFACLAFISSRLLIFKQTEVWKWMFVNCEEGGSYVFFEVGWFLVG